ncbi:MAG: GNAT family N-acetyltransferase [Candidatus Merdivicinus sp.]|jgi:ribosomal-protein-alanine N-acetyltransferase
MRIETERLVLRDFVESDLEAFFEIMRDEEVNTFLPWFPVKTLKEAEIMLRERYLEDKSGYHLAICRKEDDLPIGYIGISGGDSHDLGYGLRKEFWHHGIVTEAAAAMVEQARKDGLSFVTATHDINNPRSGGVMRNIGMRYCYTYEELCQPKNFLVHFRMYQLNLDGQDDRVFRKYWDQYPHFVEEGLEKE